MHSQRIVVPWVWRRDVVCCSGVTEYNRAGTLKWSTSGNASCKNVAIFYFTIFGCPNGKFIELTPSSQMWVWEGISPNVDGTWHVIKCVRCYKISLVDIICIYLKSIYVWCRNIYVRCYFRFFYKAELWVKWRLWLALCHNMEAPIDNFKLSISVSDNMRVSNSLSLSPCSVCFYCNRTTIVIWLLCYYCNTTISILGS
jgi:hypothetical protein